MRLPAVSTIHDTPLSLLPVAVTLNIPSLHDAPFASQTSASGLAALRCLNMSFDNMKNVSALLSFHEKISRLK